MWRYNAGSFSTPGSFSIPGGRPLARALPAGRRYAAGAGGCSPSQFTPSSPPNGDCEGRHTITTRTAHTRTPIARGTGCGVTFESRRRRSALKAAHSGLQRL